MQGIVPFVKQVVQEAGQTQESLKEGKAKPSAIMPAFARGLSTGLYNIAQGTAQLLEAFAASYKGRPFNPDNAPVQFTPLHKTADLLALALADRELLRQRACRSIRIGVGI